MKVSDRTLFFLNFGAAISFTIDFIFLLIFFPAVGFSEIPGEMTIESMTYLRTSTGKSRPWLQLFSSDSVCSQLICLNGTEWVYLVHNLLEMTATNL